MATPSPDAISLESTLQAFRDGVTSTLSPTAGASVAEGWAEKIEATGRSELGGIADGLRALADLLRSDTLDPDAIGSTMQQVGAHTAETAATHDDAAMRDRLTQLGGLVKAAGIALSGGGRPDEIAGVSTDRTGGGAASNLQDRNTADDLARNGGSPANADLTNDPAVTGSDLTKGTAPHLPK